MATASIQQIIETDCSILLMRALLNQRVMAFGEDGLGKYGSTTLAQQYTVSDFELDITLCNTDEAYGKVKIVLEGYDADEFGDVVTDRNLLISIRALLEDNAVDPNCLSYASFSEQGDHFVAFNLDVGLLLDWS